ncbi:small hydrophobic protein [Streptomyces sp. CBMA29]|uniref:small hydrophobic protein n=1 Tax=Streptomyces sp. CBMA29 TaxID=1896314 RepID=UPI001661B25E|nr:small hydrophobic protein [Streptomyces sp. CBMA29]
MARRFATTERSRRGTRVEVERTGGRLGIIGVISSVVGFFVLGIVFGPVAVVCGWLAMGRRWSGRKPLLALIALFLGALDTIIAVLYVAQ